MERSTATLRDLLGAALAEPYPFPFDANARLVRWGRYGRVSNAARGKVIQILDDGKDTSQPDIVVLPIHEIEIRHCLYLGLSIPEVFAQLLHLMLPGGPEGWESVAMGADVLTSMIASVRTLVGNATPAEFAEEIHAQGPVASMTALHLQALRPTLRITTSHNFTSWRDVYASGIPQLTMPQARYLAWPV